MLGFAVITCLCFLLTAALPSYYMDQYCGSTIALNAQPAHSLSLRLTSHDEYGPNMNCYVTVTGDEGSQIMTSFVWLDIHSFLHCPGDFMQIMDTKDVVGNSTSSQNWTSSPVCGKRRPDITMTSRSNSVTIRFISDGHFFGRGFHAVLTQFYYGTCHGSEFSCDNGRCIHTDLQCSNTNDNNSNNNTSDNDFDHCSDYSTRRQCQEKNTSSFQIIICVVISSVVFAIMAFVLVVVAWYRLRHRHRDVDEEDEEIPGRDEEEGDETGRTGRANAQRDVLRDSPSPLIFTLSHFANLLEAAGTLSWPEM